MPFCGLTDRYKLSISNRLMLWRGAPESLKNKVMIGTDTHLIIQLPDRAFFI